MNCSHRLRNNRKEIKDRRRKGGWQTYNGKSLNLICMINSDRGREKLFVSILYSSSPLTLSMLNCLNITLQHLFLKKGPDQVLCDHLDNCASRLNVVKTRWHCIITYHWAFSACSHCGVSNHGVSTPSHILFLCFCKSSFQFLHVPPKSPFKFPSPSLYVSV